MGFDAPEFPIYVSFQSAGWRRLNALQTVSSFTLTYILCKSKLYLNIQLCDLFTSTVKNLVELNKFT